jgi:hypothetical protein
MTAIIAAHEITFIEEGHQYFVDGRAVRSWSQCMADAGLLPTFPDTAFAKVANAKHRGRQIHEACAIFLRGQPLDVTQLHDESLPYVQAFCDYWRESGRSPVTVEQPLYCAELDFCCTPDFVLRDHVLDIKTTARPSLTWGLQTAAQALALDPSGAALRSIVWLRPHLKSRSYEVHDHRSPWASKQIFSPLDMEVVCEVCRGEYDGPAITAWKALR